MKHEDKNNPEGFYRELTEQEKLDLVEEMEARYGPVTEAEREAARNLLDQD